MCNSNPVFDRPFELKIGTPVTPAPGNVYTDFGYSTMPFYFRVKSPMRDRRTFGWRTDGRVTPLRGLLGRPHNYTVYDANYTATKKQISASIPYQMLWKLCKDKRRVVYKWANCCLSQARSNSFSDSDNSAHAIVYGVITGALFTRAMFMARLHGSSTRLACELAIMLGTVELWNISRPQCRKLDVEY